MRAPAVALAGLAALAGCSLKVDYKGTFYKCGADGACPSGYTCVEQQCVPSQPPPPACSMGLGAGGDHSCAIRADGTAWCWGRNDFGQLGDNSTTDRTTPVEVQGLAGAKQIEAGDQFTCAVDTGGAVWCWGHNDQGQLGDGTMTDAKQPVQVKNVTGATQIALGQGHACARLGDGSVQCWGYDDDGQLGDGTGVPNRNLAAAVVGLPKVATIAAGHDETCAIDTGGALYCWGDNNDGQLGVGDTTSRNMPAQVMGLSGVASVAIGTYFACAATTAGAVSCFGLDDQGQLGDGQAAGNRKVATPVTTELPTHAVALLAGESHACAVDDAKRLWCWGDNGSGQLGDGTTDRQITPVRALFSDVAAAAAGDHHTCVLTTAGGIQCMGDDGRGQLGNARRTTEGSPQPVPMLTGIASIAAGGQSTCAVASDGTVTCWGANGNGELGDGTTIDRATPTQVPGAMAIANVAVGRGHTCALGRDGSVTCWGNDTWGQLGDGASNTVRPGVFGTVALSGPATALALGSRDTCAIVDGAARCWGDNRYAGLGDGTTNNASTPVAVPGLSGLTAIASGGAHSCAIDGGGAVSCWGHDDHGQLGDNETTAKVTTPVAVAGVTGAVEIHAYTSGTCARTGDGSVWCWGRGDNGKAGDGKSSYNNLQAVKVVNVSGATQLAVGADMRCALAAGGTVWCWGGNWAGQIGDGTYEDRATAVQVPGLTGATAIAAGDDHACAVLADSTVECWGDDTRGELGDGVALPAAPANAQMTCP